MTQYIITPENADAVGSRHRFWNPQQSELTFQPWMNQHWSEIADIFDGWAREYVWASHMANDWRTYATRRRRFIWAAMHRSDGQRSGTIADSWIVDMGPHLASALKRGQTIEQIAESYSIEPDRLSDCIAGTGNDDRWTNPAVRGAIAFKLHKEHGVCIVALAVRPDELLHGVGTELFRVACNYVMSENGRVEMLIHPDNLVGQMFMKSVGMKANGYRDLKAVQMMVFERNILDGARDDWPVRLQNLSNDLILSHQYHKHANKCL